MTSNQRRINLGVVSVINAETVISEKRSLGGHIETSKKRHFSIQSLSLWSGYDEHYQKASKSEAILIALPVKIILESRKAAWLTMCSRGMSEKKKKSKNRLPNFVLSLQGIKTNFPTSGALSTMGSDREVFYHAVLGQPGKVFFFEHNWDTQWAYFAFLSLLLWFSMK